MYTTMPEMLDSVHKWNVAVTLAEENRLSVLLRKEHHSARWGVIFPAAIAIKINGENLTTYYALTIVFFTLAFTIFIGFARTILKPTLLIVFAVLLYFEPMMFRASTQLQPMVFALTYLGIALWGSTKFLANHQVRYLLLAALFAFCAYGAKETYLFFAVGLFGFLVWKGNIRAGAWFSIFLLIFFAVETMVFNLISGELVFGRIQHLSGGSHLSQMSGQKPVDLYQFITARWIKLPILDKLFSSVTVVYIAYLIFSRRLGQLHPFALGIILMAVSYSLLVTIIPLQVNPLIPLQPFKVEYLAIAMPLMVFITSLALNEIVSLASPGRNSQVSLAASIIAIVFLVFATTNESPFKYKLKTPLLTTIHPSKEYMFWKYNNINNSLWSGKGICSRRTKTLYLTLNIISNYLNHDNISEYLETSKFGSIRILHVVGMEPEKIKTFSPARNLFRQISKAQCIEIYGK